MSTRKPTTLIDRLVAYLRAWIGRASSTRKADRPASNVPVAPGSGASSPSATGDATSVAIPVVAQEWSDPVQEDRSETADADSSRQDEPTGPSGASVDEFDGGVAPTEHPDLEEIEEAAEPAPDASSSEPDGVAASPEPPATSSVDTDEAIDGTVSADRLPFDDATSEADLPTDEALAAIDAADLDAAETAAANAFAEDERLGSTPPLLDIDDVSTDDTVLPDDEEDVADLTGPPVDRSGFPDPSMEGDTDYAVAGYPSDHLDGEERSDPDDAGMYERETMETDPGDEADRSEEIGTLGLADSETLADADIATDAASPMPLDTTDIGVGGIVEVDDTSMLTTADLATDVDTDRGEPADVDVAATDVDAGSARIDLSDDAFDAGRTDTNLLNLPGAADGDPRAGSADAPLDEVMVAEPDDVPVAASADVEAPPTPADVASEPDAAGTMAVAAPDAGTDGRVRGDGSGACPTGYPVKGNASSKIYHLPDSASYAGTRAEWCFASEENAVAAGYRAPGKRNQGSRRRR